MSSTRVIQAFDETMAAELAKHRKSTHENCGLRKRIEELEERLSASQIRTEQLEGSLELAEDEYRRMRDILGTLNCLEPLTCGRGDYLCPSCECEEDGDE